MARFVRVFQDAKSIVLHKIRPSTVRKLRVLVILPAYNAANTIEASIRSILNQTHKQWTLAIVDDDSTDDTLELARSMADGVPNMTILSTGSNVGTYGAINLALSTYLDSNWNYFTCQGADDVSHPNRLEKMLSISSRFKPEPHFLRCRCERIDLSHPTGSRAPGPLISDGVALVSRTAFEALGYFLDTRYSGDTEYRLRVQRWLEFRELPNPIIATKTTLYTACVTGSNLTVQVPRDHPSRKAFIASARTEHAQATEVGDLYVPDCTLLRPHSE